MHSDRVGVFGWLGKRLYEKPFRLIYDGKCGLCMRSVALLRVFDLFDRIVYIALQDRETLREVGLDHLKEKDLLTDMHAACGEATGRGFLAYRMLAWRVPVLWPVLPLLYIWPVPSVGNWVYRRVADNRTCLLPTAEEPSLFSRFMASRSLRAVLILGVVVLLLGAAVGVLFFTRG